MKEITDYEETNEIKYRANRGRAYRRYLNWNDINTQWQWCIYTGLLETAAWTNHRNEHKMFRWSK